MTPPVFVAQFSLPLPMTGGGGIGERMGGIGGGAPDRASRPPAATRHHRSPSLGVEQEAPVSATAFVA